MPPQTFAFDRRAGFVDFYRENGFLVINGVYSKDDIVALTKTCDELSARRRADGKNPQSRRDWAGMGGAVLTQIAGNLIPARRTDAG